MRRFHWKIELEADSRDSPKKSLKPASCANKREDGEQRREKRRDTGGEKLSKRLTAYISDSHTVSGIYFT